MSFNDMLSPDAARLIRETEEGQARLLTVHVRSPAPVSAHSIPPLSAYVSNDTVTCGNESCLHNHCVYRRWAYQRYWEELNASEPCADLSCGNSNCFQLRSNEMSFYDDDVYEPSDDECGIHGSSRHECKYHGGSSCTKPCGDYACNHELCFELRCIEEDEEYYENEEDERIAFLRLSALFAISDDF